LLGFSKEERLPPWLEELALLEEKDQLFCSGYEGYWEDIITSLLEFEYEGIELNPADEGESSVGVRGWRL
jgi:hypothetical protein